MAITETTRLRLCRTSQTSGGRAPEVAERVSFPAFIDVSLPKTARPVQGDAGITRRVAAPHRLVLCVLVRADAAKVANPVVRAISVQMVNLLGPAAVVHGKSNAVSKEVFSLEPAAPVSLGVDNGKRGLAGAVSGYDPRGGIVGKGGLQFFNHATSYHKAEVA